MRTILVVITREIGCNNIQPSPHSAGVSPGAPWIHDSGGGWAQKIGVSGLGADTEGAVAGSTRSGGSCMTALAGRSGQAVDESDHWQDAEFCSSYPAHSGACRQIRRAPISFQAAVTEFVATRASAGSIWVRGPSSLRISQLGPFVTPFLRMKWTTSRNASKPYARQAGKLW